MRKNILILFVLFLVGCNFKDEKLSQLAKTKFKGYDKIIKNSDSIPEIIPDSKNTTTISVPSDLNKSILNLNNIIDSIYYVNLETSNNALVGTIEKLLFCDELIIVIEKIKRQSILVFSNKGKFLNKIGMKGKGPGEYLSITDVAIDYRKKKIILLDDTGQKMIYYDFKGNHIRDQKLIYFSKSVSLLNDGSFLIEQIRGLNRHLQSVSDYNLLFAQSDLNITGKALSLSYRDKYPKNELSSNSNFNITNNSILFNPVFSDTIYEIESMNKIKAKYCINTGKKNIVTKFNSSTDNQDFLDLINSSKYYYFDGKAVETDNYLYFEIRRGGDCFFSKQTSTLYYGNSISHTNDRIISFESPIATNNHFFVSILQPQYILPQIGRIKLNSCLNTILKGIKTGDNPILFFYSLK